jgi:hypothetical protein
MRSSPGPRKPCIRCRRFSSVDPLLDSRSLRCAGATVELPASAGESLYGGTQPTFQQPRPRLRPSSWLPTWDHLRRQGAEGSRFAAAPPCADWMVACPDDVRAIRPQRLNRPQRPALCHWPEPRAMSRRARQEMTPGDDNSGTRLHPNVMDRLSCQPHPARGVSGYDRMILVIPFNYRQDLT